MNPNIRQVNLGIIGCGLAARHLHLPALRKNPNNFKIICVCNHTEPKARNFAQLVGDVPYVLDYRKLLANPDIEAVDIALPIHLNYQVVKDALQAGKHVLVEKPLAGNMEQAKKLLDLHHHYPTVKMVAENCRYRPSTMKLREYLQKGVIGRPYALIWDCFNRTTGENPYMQTQWRLGHQHLGGILSDGGVHNMAVIRSLVGDIKEISSYVQCINPEIGEMDSISMLFQTVDQVCGVCNIYRSVIGDEEDKLRILGDKGTLMLIGNQIRIHTLETTLKEDVNNDLGFDEEFEDFFNAIRKNTPVLSSFYQAYKDMEPIMAAVEKKNNPTRSLP